MANPLKQLVAYRLPGALVAWAWSWRKRHFPNARQRREMELFHKLGDPDRILEGPFRGMKYLRIAYASSTLNKTVASYEKELEPAVEEMVTRAPDVFVNAGTAEGYYLVGMAMRVPGMRAVGFELASVSRHLVRRLARRNGVAERVRVHGRCSAARLQQVLEGAERPAVLCDIDGGEAPCLDPQAAPALRRAFIIVELHDMIVPGVSALIRRRFEGTHDVEHIPVRTYRPEDVPGHYGLSPEEALEVVGEQRRPDNFWYVMRPRTAGGA